MKNNTKFACDSYGKITLIEGINGFKEEITYKDNGREIHNTIYSDGVRIAHDNFGRVILFERDDGYKEEIMYENNREIHNIHYPNGIEEIERYGAITI